MRARLMVVKTLIAVMMPRIPSPPRLVPRPADSATVRLARSVVTCPAPVIPLLNLATSRLSGSGPATGGLAAGGHELDERRRPHWLVDTARPDVLK